MASIWGLTPRQSVTAECRRVGEAAVIDGCLALLQEQEYDEALLFVIGGPGAGAVLAGREGGVSGYWPRTWATRALLYAWDDRASSAVIAATSDQAWRVREMAAKVIGRHRLDDGLDAVGRLLTDPVPRVRATATKARALLTTDRSPEEQVADPHTAPPHPT